MKRKLELATLILTLIGVVVAILDWQWPTTVTGATNPGGKEINQTSLLYTLKDMFLPNAVLSVSGTGAHVEIRKGKVGTRYSGGIVSATRAISIVYLPPNQQLKLNISGTGAKLIIASELLPNIEINNTATGATVIEY